MSSLVCGLAALPDRKSELARTARTVARCACGDEGPGGECDGCRARRLADARSAADNHALSPLGVIAGLEGRRTLLPSALGNRAMSRLVSAAAATPRSIDATRSPVEGEPGRVGTSPSWVPLTPARVRVVHRLGANPGCTQAERNEMRQAIFNARGWLKKAIPKLEARPLKPDVVASLRRNFGPTHGVPASAPKIVKRLRAAYKELSTIPFSCAPRSDEECGTKCGYAGAAAGEHAVTICDITGQGSDSIRAGCVLHETFHAANATFDYDEYSGWHGRMHRSPTYPGKGDVPLHNADSYTTLVMDLS